MNRTDDVKETLSWNLAVLNKFSSDVEIILNNFDKSDDVENYVRANFSEYIDSGLLKFNRRPHMPYWHFCWAKNSFKSYVTSDFYSSLDGDNFLTGDEVSQTIKAIKDYDKNCMIHHWSGKWGDGTSGRITIPTALYRKNGYINELLPRQFDEISVLLTGITKFNLPVLVRTDKNIVNSSREVTRFIETNKLSPSFIKCNLGEQKLPLNPRGDSYVKEDDSLTVFHNFNMYYSLYKCSIKKDAEELFKNKLIEKQQEYSNSDIITERMNLFFKGEDLAKLEKNDMLTIYTVAKDEELILEKWYRHYKAKGVKRFVIVDDNSRKAIKSSLPYNDVLVVKPRFADFKSAKAFWLRILIGNFQKEGSWALTVDVDELLDVPYGELLQDYIAKLEESNQRFSTGVLIEMLPEKLSDHKVTAENFTERMDHCLYRKKNEHYDYQNINSIKWAFSEYWPLSFAFDFRYRYFGTVDSLRKVPLFKYDKSIQLNQGFHAVRYDGKEPSIDEYFKGEHLIKIRHYKFFKFLCSEFDKGNYEKTFNQYHERTKMNLKKIANIKENINCRAWEYSPFKTKYSILPELELASAQKK